MNTTLPPATAAAAHPELLALDWGTSRLRAFLMQDGAVIDERQSAHGIQHLPAPGLTGFEHALAEIAGDWLQRWPQLPIVASGMVGSAQGWREAPYVRCPAALQDLAAHGVSVDSGFGRAILIAPGVLFDVNEQAPACAPFPDVMRGEEIQIAGALQRNPQWADRACIILPGTHSKWVWIENGRITRFATYLTGELFAVLSTHSILGRLMTAAAPEQDAAAFAMGLAAARSSRPGDLSHQLFATRTLGLTGRLPPSSLADFLSGLLIGHELRSGLAQLEDAAQPLLMIGTPELCQRYASALSAMDHPAAAQLDNTAPHGLWHFARACGRLA